MTKPRHTPVSAPRPAAPAVAPATAIAAPRWTVWAALLLALLLSALWLAALGAFRLVQTLGLGEAAGPPGL